MRQLFVSRDSVVNHILRESFNPFIELFRTSLNATRYTAFGLLICLVTAAIHRSSFTSALNHLQNHAVSINGIEIKKKIELPPLYKLSEYMKKISITDAIEAINQALKQQVMLAASYGWTEHFNILIADAHEIPAWNRVHTELIVPIYSAKKANSKGFRYFTSVVGDGKWWLTTAFYIDGPAGSPYDIDEAHVANDSFKRAHILGFKIRCGIFDSRFFTVDTVEQLTYNNYPFLMIASKNNRVKNAVLSGHRSLCCHYEPMVVPMEIGSGRNKVTYNLLIAPRPKEKRIVSPKNRPDDILSNYVTLATNMDAFGSCSMMDEVITMGKTGIRAAIKRWVMEKAEFDYRRRANIEVSYKMQEQVRARTNTRNNALRVLLFGMMAVLYNLHVLLKMYNELGVIKRARVAYLQVSDLRIWRFKMLIEKWLLVSYAVLLLKGSGEWVRMHKYLRTRLKVVLVL